MRRAPAIVLAACLAGCLVLALVARADERTLAFTLNVDPLAPIAVVQPGKEACQRWIEAPADFDVVEFLLGTYGRPGPPLLVTIHDARRMRVIATGRLPAGARDNSGARVRLGAAVPEGTEVHICLRNAGARRVALYGGPAEEGPGDADVAGAGAPGDLLLVFHRSEPRSALSLVPDMLERAARFRPPLVGAWTLWLVLAAVAAGMPVLLAVALRRALGEDDPDPPRT